MSIQLWHGARRWQGQAEIRPAKKGRCEHGTGLYCTTSIETAQKYAKGGGLVAIVVLSSDIRWLQDVKLELAQMQEFVQNCVGLRNRVKIQADLTRSAERIGRSLLSSEILVNLCVNHDVYGKPGVELAQWLSLQGIDASLVEQSGQENWVVVFNPKKIIAIETKKSREIDWKNANFDPVRKQVAAT